MDYITGESDIDLRRDSCERRYTADQSCFGFDTYLSASENHVDCRLLFEASYNVSSTNVWQAWKKENCTNTGMNRFSFVESFLY